MAGQCLLFSIMATEGPARAAKDPEKFGDTPDSGVCKKMMLGLLGEHKGRLTQLREVISEDEGLHCDAMIRGLSLPPRGSVDKIIRYETSIERQLYRAVSHLERLQRRRMGELIPPPVSIDVTTGK